MERINANELLITRGDGLLEAEVDGEMVALHVDNGTCYSFNATAYRIWKLIERPTTLDQVCSTLSDDFEVDLVTCEHDVRDVLDDLARDGLVTLSAR